MPPQPRPEIPARLAELAPEVAAAVVRVAGDIALVIGDDGVIRNVADSRVRMPCGDHEWVGKRWADTVSASARGTVEALLREARVHGVSRRSELNHPAAEGGDIPYSWAAVRLGEGGPLLAVGRDLRAVNAIQRRFVDAQVSLERDYWQRRDAESHQRLLHQVAHDAVLVLEADGSRVRQANAAAAELFAPPGGDWAAFSLAGFVGGGQRALVDDLLRKAGDGGGPIDVQLRATPAHAALELSALMFRAEAGPRLLLRARRAADVALPEVQAFLQHSPLAVFVTDASARVLWASAAFCDLCQADDDSQVRGRALDALLGEAVPWAALPGRVRGEGLVALEAVALEVAGGPRAAATLTASALFEGDQERLGFTLQRLPGVAAPPARPGPRLSVDLAAPEQALGLAPLDRLMAEAARQVETRLVGAALRQGGGLDAAAARLGIGTAALRQRMAALALGPDGLPAEAC